jgi:integration host factor subunit beta
MTKNDLIRAISQKQPHLQKKEVSQAVNCIFNHIAEALVAKERVEIRNFGVFSLHYRVSRKGRDFISGESLHLPPRYAAHFKAGKELRIRIAQSANPRSHTQTPQYVPDNLQNQ